MSFFGSITMFGRAHSPQLTHSWWFGTGRGLTDGEVCLKYTNPKGRCMHACASIYRAASLLVPRSGVQTYHCHLDSFALRPAVSAHKCSPASIAPDPNAQEKQTWKLLHIVFDSAQTATFRGFGEGDAHLLLENCYLHQAATNMSKAARGDIRKFGG